MALVADTQEGAAWMANELIGMGYQADFSLESLKEIDRFFDDHGCGDPPSTDEGLREQAKSRLFALGGYVGETIRKAYRAQWIGDDCDPKGAVNISIRFPNGTEIWPVQRVVKRFLHGPGEGIYGYGRAVGDYADSQSPAYRQVIRLSNEPGKDGPAS